MKKIFYSDLDNTLVYSDQKVKEYDGDMITVETFSNGGHGYMSTREIDLIKELKQDGYIIPVTTRSIDQARRIDLFKESTYAICSNGGNIFVNGEVDEEYSNMILEEMKKQNINLIWEQLRMEVRYAGELEINRNVDDCFIFIKFRQEELLDNFFSDLTEMYKDSPYEVFRIGKKMYVIPSFVSKKSAIEYLNNKFINTISLGAGDSEMDRGLLESVNYPITPAHNTLKNNPFKVTKNNGMCAGEEILMYVKEVWKS